MPNEYGTHADYLGRIKEEIQSRQQDVEAALKEVFAGFLETRTVDVIIFANVGVMDLAEAKSHPPDHPQAAAHSVQHRGAGD